MLLTLNCPGDWLHLADNHGKANYGQWGFISHDSNHNSNSQLHTVNTEWKGMTYEFSKKYIF